MYAIFYFDREEYRQRPVGGYNPDGTINLKLFATVKDAERFQADWNYYRATIQRWTGGATTS